MRSIGISWMDERAAREKRALRHAVIARVEAALAAESFSEVALNRHEWPIAFRYLLRLVHPSGHGLERLADALLDPRGTSLLPFRLSVTFNIITKHGRRHPHVDLAFIKRARSAGALIVLAILGACGDWNEASRPERAGVLLGNLVRRRTS